MPDTGTVSNTRRTHYDVTWNNTALGYSDQVTPDIGMQIEPIKVGSVGKAKLGDRFVGLEDGASIKVTLRECTRAMLQKLMPWATQTAKAALDLTPTVNKDLYDYAQVLLLHPRDKAAADGEDVSLSKTVPIRAVPIPHNGEADTSWEVTFLIYPDRASLPALVYGSVLVQTS